MTTTLQNAVRKEEGFTLVELAVVMIIIGLLVGGILKGQEMIANAQVTSTVAQYKAVDGAVGTFVDVYNGFPGDILTPGTRITNCAGACNVDGNANGHLDNSPLAAAGGEETAFFLQLAAADLVTGVTPANNFLDGSIRGTKWRPGWVDGTVALGDLASPHAGNYLSLTAASGFANAGLTPLEAARMDRKIDDGVANTGSAGAGGDGATCSAAGVYAEARTQDSCRLVVRING